MLNEPVIEKLQTMRLGAMADAWLEQQRNAKLSELSFDERFGMIVEAEWLTRENRRLARTLKEAKLRLSNACIEDVEFTARRGLDKAVVRQLATCRWVAEHQSVCITGATGVGKTYLACALAQQACRRGHRAMYRRATRLFDEMKLARADGSYARMLMRMARMDVLVIDDFAITPMTDTQRSDLLEVLEDRCGTRSTIVTSQLPTPKWHDYLSDPTLADAICDRILHQAHRIVLKGPTRRSNTNTDNK
jgi:DNA replication protein DnaC